MYREAPFSNGNNFRERIYEGHTDRMNFGATIRALQIINYNYNHGTCFNGQNHRNNSNLFSGNTPP